MNRTDWRWTSSPLRFGGLHASLCLFFPLLIVTGLSRYTFIAMGLYAAYLAYCRSSGMGPLQRLRWLRLKHLNKGQWPAF